MMLERDDLSKLREVRRKLAQALAELEVMSEVSSAEPGKRSASADEEIGGRTPGMLERPPRDHDERIDYHAWQHKDAEHFRRRIKRARSLSALEMILADLTETIAARRRTPTPSSPTLDDPQWKRWIGESDEKTSDLARRFDVSPQYINRVRRDYRARQAA